MKRILPVILLFGFSVSFAQNSAIDRAKRLIEAKQYESAFKVLNDTDPQNNDPAIVIAKTGLCMNYFVSTGMYRMFALTNLQEDEDITDARGKEEHYALFSFAPDSLLSRLIEKYPENYELYKTLGNYYFEVYLQYGNDWFISGSGLVARFRNNLLKAYDHGVYDDVSLYGLGYSELLSESYGLAIYYTEQSLSLNNNNPSGYSILAYAYWYAEGREKAIENAKIALDLYQDPVNKADAARLIALVSEELDQYDDAKKYYELADQLSPGNYFTLKPLLNLDLELDSPDYRDRTLDFFRLDPDNPAIYQDLMTIYGRNNRQDELIGFLDAQKPAFQDDTLVLGNLYFYTGVVQYEMDDKANSRANFEKARELFREVYDESNSIFDTINSYLE